MSGGTIFNIIFFSILSLFVFGACLENAACECDEYDPYCECDDYDDDGGFFFFRGGGSGFGK